MHLKITISILFLFSTRLFAQWSQFPNTPTADIFCVRATDPSNYYAGLGNAIVKTSDAGANWIVYPINDLTGSLVPSLITDVYFISATEAVAVGWIVLGNSEVILKTNNGGLNWSFANVYNGGSWPREQNALDFVSSSTGYSVGSNGRILKTIDGGNTWSLLSTSTTAEFWDVDFTSTSTGFAVGNQRILKTTNGTTWTSTTFSGKVFKTVHFPSANVGYAAGEDGVVYKTTNAGVTWTALNVNAAGVDFTSAYFTDDNTGYITGNQFIYRTTTGGLYWERKTMANDMNGITFFSAQDGLAVGDVNQFYHTANAGIHYKPQPNFTIAPTTNCFDSIVQLTNLSDPSWTFQWLLDGTPFSTTYSISVVPTTSGNHTISLVASNGFESDTLTKSLTVQPSLDINLNVGVANQICAGQVGQVSVYNSEVGVNYLLRNGTTPIGTQQAGNGNTLNFNTGALSTSTTLNIRATKTNSCGTNEEVAYVTVVTQNPDINKVIFADPDTICVNTSTSVFLQNSQNNVSYKLMSGTTTIGAIQSGNGGVLTFPTPVLNDTTTYFIRGTSSPLNCVTNFPPLTIVVQDPNLYFSVTNMNPEINEPIAVLNNSSNTGGTYAWDFGSGASPATSNSTSVSGLTYANTGTKTITLTATTSTGCIEQITKTIHAINPVTNTSCNLIQYAGDFAPDGGRLNALTRDNNDNLYTFYENNSSNIVYMFTGNGDTLVNNTPQDINYDEAVTLTKHNPKGVPMWSTYLTYGSTWSDGGDVLTDTAGNVYMVYFHGDHVDDVHIYSTDGSYITIDPPISGSSLQSSVIVKFDPNGKYLWHKTVLDSYTVDQLSLKFDELGNLLYCGTFFYKIAPNGTILQNIQFQSKYDAVADGQGGVYVTGYGFNYEYLGNGTPIPMPPFAINSGVAESRYIKMDEFNNIYMAGKFHGQFTFGNTTLTDTYVGGQVHEDLFICRINNDGTAGWIKQLSSDWQNSIRGFDVKNGRIVLAAQTISDTFSIVGGPSITGPNGTIKNLLFQCTTGGNVDQLMLFSETGDYYGTTHNYDLIRLNNDATKIDYGFEYKDNFVTPSGISVENYPIDYRGNGIITATINCMFNIPELPPVTNFSVPSACMGQNVYFSDASTNAPSSWSWTFQGGTPASSTDQNPVVEFATPGLHTVTLTTSNAYGTGTTVTQQINVTFTQAENDWITTDTVCYSSFGTQVNEPLNGGGNLSFSDASTISNGTFYPDQNSLGTFTVIEYAYVDGANGCYLTALDSIYISNDPQPNSNIEVNGSTCVNTAISFIDQSSGNPNAWSWTFEGGTPAVSNQQNPQVVFDTLGYHVITLVASSGMCEGTITSYYVYVEEASNQDDWIFDETFCYLGDPLYIGTPVFSGGTFTPANVSNGYYNPLSGSNEGVVPISYTYLDVFSGCTGTAHDTNTIHDVVINMSSFPSHTMCYNV
ncbi:MAG: PKD domain-containing protein, partial [Fluviicola sp.]|nr:PKD domain-containing protein [Fluviicola sp.]